MRTDKEAAFERSAPSNEAIYLAALEIVDEAERQAFIENACGGDAERRRTIERLLAVSETGAASPLDRVVEQLGAAPTCAAQPETSAEFDLDAPAIDVSTHPTIDRYKLLEQVGEGGMGVVFMAQQTHPVKRRVALKLIKPGMDSREVIARFEAERQALAMMDHPNIARVFDAGTTAEGRPYFVMELVRGVPITDYCDHERLSIPTRLRLLIDVCRAVQHAHQKGIIHRDLKPSNVMITLHDGVPIVKVIDFGVAKALNQELCERTLFTQFAQMIGTPLYMSPEQAEMSGLDVDTRSDIYSLGVLLYELLTGSTPFDKKAISQAGVDAVRRMICEVEPSRPSHKISTLEAQLLSTVSLRRKTDPRQLSISMKRELDWITMKALEKDRNRRYETANAFADDLQHFLNDEPVQACPPSVRYRLSKSARRHKAVIATLSVIAATMVIGSGFSVWQAMLAKQASATAETETRKATAANANADLNLAAALDAQAMAEQQEALAKQQRDVAMLNQYRAEIVSGQMDWERNYLQRLNSKLIGHLPLAGGQDRRGWEWYYLYSLCRPEVRTLYFTDSSPFAAWSPDGEYFGASGSIWRAESGENIRRLRPSRIKLYRSAWSPDGQRFAWGTASDDSCIYIWNRQTDELRELRGHKESVWCVNWSPDGKQLASGGIGSEIYIWDAETGLRTKTFDAGDYITDVAWSPDGELLAAGIKKHDLAVWEMATSELACRITGLGGPGAAYQVQLSWHPDGEQLAVSTPQSWSLVRRSDWSVIREQEMTQERGNDVAWRPDGQRLAVADGETIAIWQPSGDVPEHVLRGPLSPVSSVSWSPDGQQLVSSGVTGEIKVWDVNAPLQPPAISTGGPLQSMSWAPDSVTLLTTSASDGSVSFWDTQSGRQLRTEVALAEGQGLWSPDRRLVAYHSETSASEVRILNSPSGETHSVLHGDATFRIGQSAWSRDGTKLAVRTDSGKATSVEVWDVDQERLISRWIYRNTLTDTSDLRSKMEWSEDSGHLAVSLLGKDGDDGTIIWQGHVYVVHVATGATVLKHNVGGRSHRADVASLAWNPNGEGLVAGSRDGVIEAIEVPSGQILFSTRLHSTSVDSLAWSPDGERIASAAQDGSVKILKSKGGDDLLTFTLKEGVRHVAWSRDARRLAAATNGGEVHVWDASRGYEFSKQGRRRGELAWAYYEAPRQKTPEMERARLREVLELAPDALDFWELRGHASVRLGDFDRATAEFAKAIEPGLSRSFGAAEFFGDALLGARKLDTYGRHCIALLEEFEDTDVPSTGGHVAWACCLVQDRRIDSGMVLRLARANADANADDGGDRAMLCLGAALYRCGRYEEAARVLSDLAAKLESSGDSSANSDRASLLYFLAMTRHRLNDAFQSRRYLGDAARLAADIQPELSWYVNVQLQVLGREARSLIGD